MSRICDRSCARAHPRRASLPLQEGSDAGEAAGRRTQVDRPTLASPVDEQVVDLGTGQCLDDPAVRLPVHLVRLRDGLVEVALEAEALSA